ncbi:MAG: hypothetical protein ACD_50C00320G0002 [uncultured bacterium]|nr:MAG: hypothetical protein ACD_50C00320G0002 [uncultured bacterium]OGH14800.1 MAG: nicotinate (nicotinamide) nucleotide adenylyltransferase [Candidatus Levybacteria bacterium RIFCSPHIGHO2_01_FULL_38_26]
MKIGVLGGSFDPPHNGHLFVAKELLKQKAVEKIILMPVFKHPFGKQVTQAKHRLAMTKLLDNENIIASDMELKKEGLSYSTDTLRALKNQFPKDDFAWIMGEDQLKDFKKWKGWKEIKEKFGLMVVPRKLAVSSSEIRKRIKMGKDIADLVPKEVKSYIMKHNLYA